MDHFPGHADQVVFRVKYSIVQDIFFFHLRFWYNLQSMASNYLLKVICELYDHQSEKDKFIIIHK